MPEISIITAVFNSLESELQMAVDSVLNQTFSDFELILCDDGSTAEIGEMIRLISEKDDRIKYFRNPVNMKASIARNKCLEVAQGDYIAIMDADDYSAPERLEKQLAFLKKNPQYGFVGCKTKYFTINPQDEDSIYWYCASPQKKDFLFTPPFVHASILFRKSVLVEMDGYCIEKIVHRSEDYDLLMRVYAKGYLGYNLPEVLYYYRVNDNTYKRRKYRYRFNEVIVRYRGFKKLGLLPKGIIYAIKPLAVGLIPISMLNRMKQIYYRNKVRL